MAPLLVMLDAATFVTEGGVVSAIGITPLSMGMGCVETITSSYQVLPIG